MSRNQVRIVIAEADNLVAAARDLVATATEQSERLRANLIEFRVLELKRQLILGRIRRTLERAEAQGARRAKPGRLDDLATMAPVSTTIH